FLYVHDNITRAFEQAHLKLFEEVFRTIAPRWQFKGSVLRNVEGVTDLTGSELNACALKHPYAALVARIRRQALPCDNNSDHLLASDPPITLPDCEGDGRTKHALGPASQEGCMGTHGKYGGVDTGQHERAHPLGAVHETGDNYI